jgi:SAM-dependent methyltransferase
MEMVDYVGRAVARLKSKGIGNTSKYALHIVKERALASAIDLRFGGKLCTTNLDETIYKDGVHTMVHSDFHVLRDIFSQVPIAKDDVLVDVGCGEGRVINFWLSRGLKNQMIGLEIVDEVAKRTRERYRKYPNVSIIHGDAVANPPPNGTIFFLYNPFGENQVPLFERAVRNFKATIVYYQNNYMNAFDRRYWDVKPLASKGRVYQYSAAIITARAH